MPPSYAETGGGYSASQTTTTTTNVSSPAGIGLNKAYLTTIPGILKICEVVSIHLYQSCPTCGASPAQPVELVLPNRWSQPCPACGASPAQPVEPALPSLWSQPFE